MNRADDAEILARIEEIERESGGKIAMMMRDLQTGESVGYEADCKAPAASVIKFPILVHVAMGVREGRHSWEEPLTMTDADRVGGSGVLTLLSDGLTLSLRDACVLMIAVSDNSATNLVIERVGVDAVNGRMRDLGLTQTTLFRKIGSTGPPVCEENALYGIGVVTPAEMTDLILMLAEGAVGDAETSAGVLEILAMNQLQNNIPRYLPSDWKYAGKTGSLDHVRNDVGLVTAPDGRRFALALFCRDIPGVRWTADNPRHLALARIAETLLLR